MNIKSITSYYLINDFKRMQWLRRMSMVGKMSKYKTNKQKTVRGENPTCNEETNNQPTYKQTNKHTFFIHFI